jgi:hypothetical protein
MLQHSIRVPHSVIPGGEMKVQCRVFESTTKSWESLVQEASTFATSQGRERLINISVSAAGGSDAFGLGAKGAIFVWFWDKSA